MALSVTRLRALRGRSRPYQVADGAGLFVEVLPGGKRVWRLRYRLHGRQEKVTLGEYPVHSLTVARRWREECREQIARGESPMAAKRKAKTSVRGAHTVAAFADRWMEEVVVRDVKDPRTIRRVLKKDIVPAIGRKTLGEVTPLDVLAITDRIKARGADQMALATRNVLKRLFAYAIAREQVTHNPAAAIEARYIAQAKSRDVALSPTEIGELLRGIYASSMRRSHKLALHLLVICMIRKSELLKARWSEFDLEACEWAIPGERMKKQKPHVVYLSTQASSILEELNTLASGSDFVLPSRSTLSKHISRSTLNVAIRGLDLDIQDFVIHDFRRTASTRLHEAGFAPDWIEKALSHKQQGVRGIYNRAEYAEQRKRMLQQWADFVDAQIEDGKKVVLGRFGRLDSSKQTHAAG
jgi:integrase